jgi:hypothetical protein
MSKNNEIKKNNQNQVHKNIETIKIQGLDESLRHELSNQEAEAVKGGYRLRPVTACEISSF